MEICIWEANTNALIGSSVNIKTFISLGVKLKLEEFLDTGRGE